MTWKKFLEYKRKNDHSWYDGVEFIRDDGGCFHIKDLDYSNMTYQFKYSRIKNAFWGPVASQLPIKQLLKESHYYSPLWKEMVVLEESLKKMKEEF